MSVNTITSIMIRFFLLLFNAVTLLPFKKRPRTYLLIYLPGYHSYILLSSATRYYIFLLSVICLFPEHISKAFFRDVVVGYVHFTAFAWVYHAEFTGGLALHILDVVGAAVGLDALPAGLVEALVVDGADVGDQRDLGDDGRGVVIGGSLSLLQAHGSPSASNLYYTAGLPNMQLLL